MPELLSLPSLSAAFPHAASAVLLIPSSVPQHTDSTIDLNCCEDDLLIMCQIESVAAVNNIEAIADVDVVDCLQMGPLDLSASMGFLWDPGNTKVRGMLREVERRVLGLRKAGKEMAPTPYLAGFAAPFDPPEDMKFRGYHMVAGAADVGMFRKAAVEDIMRFRLAGTEIVQKDGDD